MHDHSLQVQRSEQEGTAAKGSLSTFNNKTLAGCWLAGWLVAGWLARIFLLTGQRKEGQNKNRSRPCPDRQGGHSRAVLAWALGEHYWTMSST